MFYKLFFYWKNEQIVHFLFFGVRWAKMSNRDQFAQVAQRKWAIVSKFLRSLTKNERMSESLIFLSELLLFLSESLICSKKNTSDSLGKPMSVVPALPIFYTFPPSHLPFPIFYACPSLLSYPLPFPIFYSCPSALNLLYSFYIRGSCYELSHFLYRAPTSTFLIL